MDGLEATPHPPQLRPLPLVCSLARKGVEGGRSKSFSFIGLRSRSGYSGIQVPSSASSSLARRFLSRIASISSPSHSSSVQALAALEVS